MTITTAAIRAYANLPSEVPDALLSEHMDIAVRDVGRATGLEAAPSGLIETWEEAITVRALASVFPWLHTFALDGVAKAGRLEGAVDFRFLDPDEAQQRIDDLNARFKKLVAVLSATNPDMGDDQEALYGPVVMIAI